MRMPIFTKVFLICKSEITRWSSNPQNGQFKWDQKTWEVERKHNSSFHRLSSPCSCGTSASSEFSPQGDLWGLMEGLASVHRDSMSAPWITIPRRFRVCTPTRRDATSTVNSFQKSPLALLIFAAISTLSGRCGWHFSAGNAGHHHDWCVGSSKYNIWVLLGGKKEKMSSPFFLLQDRCKGMIVFCPDLPEKSFTQKFSVFFCSF